MAVVLLLDMDGVLTRDKELNPFPDAADFLTFLRSQGVPFKIVSNNSTRPPRLIARALKEKGLPVEEDELISPVAVLPKYLKSRGLKRLFVIGTEQLKSFLKEEGFEVVDDHRVDAVVVGQDKTIDFKKVKTATSALYLSKAELVPVNLSRLVKDSDGLYFPGAGSWAKMLAYATGYEKELPNLGKPELLKLALKELPEGEAYMVSDDLYTDLKGAKEMGLKTVFMTTGKYPPEELERAGFRPDFVFNSLTELKEALRRWLGS
ncbi:MAG: HAD-IIA family hydrolase [Aquificae bacterium]|nr:HAD-IIA family hydrolase [Aquificota bacterium]